MGSGLTITIIPPRAVLIGTSTDCNFMNSENGNDNKYRLVVLKAYYTDRRDKYIESVMNGQRNIVVEFTPIIMNGLVLIGCTR